MMQFANPKYLWMLLVLVPLIVWYVYKQRNDHPTLSLSSLSAFADRGFSLRATLRHLLFVIRLGAIACLIIVLCRPLLDEDKRERWDISKTEGTDIVLALDISSSMLARDFNPNRLEEVKRVAIDFANGRPNDNIGVVVFSGESMTALPMTMDHEAIESYISSLQTGMLEDGTHIGDGIGTSINALKDGKAKSKSIILLTDGSDTGTGLIPPRDAGKLAKDNQIKVYTIGVGTRGKAPYPAIDMFGNRTYQMMDVVIDEDILRDIASETGGKYFRATDKTTLENVFTEIDALEKTQMDVETLTHNEDDPGIWPWLALALLLLELGLRYTIFRTTP